MNKTTDTMERKMKDSGIPWIGIIPEDWMVAQFKRFHKGTNVGESIDKMYWTENTNDIPFYTAGLNPIYTNFKYFPAEKYTKSEDLLMARNGTPYVYLPIINAAYTDHVIRVSLKNKINKVYAFYALSLAIRSEIVETVSLPTWSASIWNNQILPIPPLSEQEAIASWLDEKCGEIDELIEVEQKMIEELEVYRQALITETVTRGLNPEATMRQTGISWIPEIPEHWETITLRGLSKKFRKGSGITKEDLMENGDILCIRYGDLYTKYDFHMSNIQCRTNVDKIASPVYGEYGDILFTCSGEDIDAIGKSAALLCSEPCLIGGDLIIMKHDQYPKFLGYSISSEIAQKQKSYGKSKLKVVHTSVKDLKNVIIALPPIEEQQAIADYLDTKCKEIDELIAVKREKIDTLKQYRQSIIFEAVTGKLNI